MNERFPVRVPAAGGGLDAGFTVFDGGASSDAVQQQHASGWPSTVGAGGILGVFGCYHPITVMGVSPSMS